jgi:hypothetical protein
VQAPHVHRLSRSTRIEPAFEDVFGRLWATLVLTEDPVEVEVEKYRLPTEQIVRLVIKGDADVLARLFQEALRLIADQQGKLAVSGRVDEA